MGQITWMFIFGSIAVALIVIGIIVMIFKFYRKVEQGQALIINKLNDKLEVTFTGGVVIPIIHKAEIMDISVKAMEIERTAKNGLICEDNVRADIRVTFYVRVNKTREDVLKVAQGVGCQRASTQETLEELFQAKFSEALKTVGKKMEFATLFTERVHFKEQIIEVIGEDLNGYKLEDVAIDYLEQTPLDSLDPDNIMDAQGIRKIIDMTSDQAKRTNELRRDKERVIKQQDVETREKVLELERQQADAEARQAREIATIQSREKAEAEKVEAEEHLKAERARIAADEEVAVANENKERQIEVALKAKERTIAVENERVKREAQLEAVERERMVAIKDIEKEKAVEVEKKQIQDVIRERVMVEKTVAVEQEKIKDTVQLAEAERLRKVQVIEAEREAEMLLIKETKAAEAKEKSAKSLYEEKITHAEAEKVEAEKKSDAKKILAEGVVAEQSAEGLAKVKVREEEARIIELEGKAKANASTEQYNADAHGTETTGAAEAKAMAAKYDAEAEGITKKADAMKKLDGIGKEHEEFKLKLGKQERVELAAIEINRKIAEAQATVLSEAMKQANIDIVGGNGEFLNNFFKSISLGKSVDAFVDKSEVADKFLTGNGGKEIGFLDTVKEAVMEGGLSAESIKDLSLSALLTKYALGSDDPELKKLGEKIKGKDIDLKEVLSLWLAK